MNKGLWIAKKHELVGLIKKLSDWYGGDDVEALKDYCRDVLRNYPDDSIMDAIICFTDLVEQLKYVPRRTKGV